MTLGLQQTLQAVAKEGVVVCDQNSHRFEYASVQWHAQVDGGSAPGDALDVELPSDRGSSRAGTGGKLPVRVGRCQKLSRTPRRADRGGVRKTGFLYAGFTGVGDALSASSNPQR
jgi:hypothetical protein